MNLFGERLKALRKERKLKQPELAAVIGLSFRQIQRYEAKEQEPTLDTLIFLARYFEVTTDYLLGLTDKREISA